MKVLMVIILLALAGVLIWQGALLIRDIVKKVKSKKEKKNNENISGDTAGKE